MLLICDKALKVTAVSSGKAALEELRSNPPDLMLLDIIMPNMDGWQVLEQKRRDETIKNIPVAMVSAEDITDQPIHSKVLLATIGPGFSTKKLLDCSLQLAARVMNPDSELDPVLE
jgi:CheY-like chemotaxis protein